MRRAEFAGLIAHRLQRGGFEVASLQQVRAVAERVSEAHPGCFDRLTGRSEARCHQQRVHELYAELHQSLGCDAFLRASIAPVTAAFAESVVQWDGAVRRKFSGMSSLGSRGWVLAASLRIAIHDRDAEQIYWRSGGIEALASLHGRSYPYPSIFRSQGVFDPRPADRMLRDPARNMSAVLLSLGPLAGPDSPETESCLFAIKPAARQMARARCEVKLHPPPAPQPITEAAKEDGVEGAPPEAAP